jgi:hypothetical protein
MGDPHSFFENRLVYRGAASGPHFCAEPDLANLTWRTGSIPFRSFPLLPFPFLSSLSSADSFDSHRECMRRTAFPFMQPFLHFVFCLRASPIHCDCDSLRMLNVSSICPARRTSYTSPHSGPYLYTYSIYLSPASTTADSQYGPGHS